MRDKKITNGASAREPGWKSPHDASAARGLRVALSAIGREWAGIAGSDLQLSQRRTEFLASAGVGPRAIRQLIPIQMHQLDGIGNHLPIKPWRIESIA